MADVEMDTPLINFFSMDAGYCFALSAAEAFALHHGAFQSYVILLQRFLLYFVLQFLAIKILKTLIYPAFLSPLRNIPGPKDNFPLLGQVVNQIKQTDPTSLYVKWINDYPDAPLIRYLSFGNSEVLLITSLKVFKDVLQTKCYSFTKPNFFKRIIGEIVGGLVFTEGDEHKRQRRLLAGPFSHANLKALGPLFHEKAIVLINRIHQRISNHSDGTVMNVSEVFTEVALNIIGLTTLGIELDHMGRNTDFNFQECYHRILEQPAIGNVISVINMYIPVRSWLPLEANRRFVAANNDLRKHLRGVIKTRREDIKSGKVTDGKDLLTLMLQEHDSTSKSASNPWTDDDVLGHILGFMAAGHETAAGALTWSVYCMCMYPNIQAKLRDEITVAFPAADEHRVPTWEEIESLKYLHNFAREVLRRYSPTINAPRESTTDMIIEGQHIPKGTSMIVAMAAANLHPRIWGDDVMEFRPERWDELGKSDPGSDPFALETFINGPRTCIGKNFALFEIKMLLVHLVRRFRFEWPVGVAREVELVNTFVLKPKGGLRVGVREIP